MYAISYYFITSLSEKLIIAPLGDYYSSAVLGHMLKGHLKNRIKQHICMCNIINMDRIIQYIPTHTHTHK